MRHKGWLAIALTGILAGMFFTASCSKKAVRTEQQSMTAQDVRKAPDRPAEEPKPDPRLEEGRLQAEAAAREAAAREAAAREAAAREAALAAFVSENIHFEFDSYLLSEQARQILIRKAGYLRTNPGIAVTVEGHCDHRGTSEYNLALGERRAESVKKFLVGLGIGTHRLNTVSYGEERPIAMGHDEASWARNRSARFVINGFPDDRISSKN